MSLVVSTYLLFIKHPNHCLNELLPFHCCGLALVLLALFKYFGANASNIAVVMAVKLYSCCHPQSWRALLSSRTWGQLSAEIRSSHFKSDIQKKIYIQPSRLACQGPRALFDNSILVLTRLPWLNNIIIIIIIARNTMYIEKRKGAVKMRMMVLKMHITQRHKCD